MIMMTFTFDFDDDDDYIKYKCTNAAARQGFELGRVNACGGNKGKVVMVMMMVMTMLKIM